MSCPFSLESVKFRETAHIAYEDEYVTAYQSTDIVPTIYKSVNTPERVNIMVNYQKKDGTRSKREQYLYNKLQIKMMD